MDIAVAGGTGMLGRAVVAQLTTRGHDVRVLTRRPPGQPQPAATHHAVDLVAARSSRSRASSPASQRRASPTSTGCPGP